MHNHKHFTTVLTVLATANTTETAAQSIAPKYQSLDQLQRLLMTLLLLCPAQHNYYGCYHFWSHYKWHVLELHSSWPTAPTLPGTAFGSSSTTLGMDNPGTCWAMPSLLLLLLAAWQHHMSYYKDGHDGTSLPHYFTMHSV